MRQVAREDRRGETTLVAPDKAVGFAMVLKAIEVHGPTGCSSASGASILSVQRLARILMRAERRGIRRAARPGSLLPPMPD
jgi:hypothetical protein